MMKKTLGNSKGVLTVDFIFGAMIVFALSSVIFSFAMAFSVVEIVQYISYASARNYSLAHLNETKQKERGELKFQQLSTHPSFAPMLDMGWFELAPVMIADAGFNEEYGPDESYDSDNFFGARIALGAPILYKRIPLVGNTADDRDAFQVNIQSFLAREPTFSECRDFMLQRAQQMLNLGSNYQLENGQAVVIMDNGC